MRSFPEPVIVISAIQPTWRDFNNHVNYAAYALAADPAIDATYAAAGLDASYRSQNNCSDYILQSRFHYLKEIRQSDRIEVRCRLVDFDSKRAHIFCEILAHESGTLAAIAHIIGMHVDTASGRSLHFSAEAIISLDALRAEHEQLSKPAYFDKTIAFSKPDLML